MNYALIAILVSCAAVPPQSDPQCQKRCDRRCTDVEDVSDFIGQDPDDEDIDDVAEAEEAAEAADRALEEAEEAAAQAAEEAQAAAEEAQEAARTAAEEAEEAAEEMAAEAQEVAERAAEEAAEAVEQATRSVEECLKQKLEGCGSGLDEDSVVVPQCVKDSLKTTQKQLRELVAAARSSQGSGCGKNKRAKEIAQAERAFADIARVQGTESYQRAMELAKDQGALAQVLAAKGVEVSEATRKQLEQLARMGYTAAVSFPRVAGDGDDDNEEEEDAQSRSLEERIQVLEKRLGVEDHDGRSLEKRVEELERMLQHSLRLERRSPGALSGPRTLLVPGGTGQTLVVPGIPSIPAERFKAPRGHKGKSKAKPPSEPDHELWETPAPMPPAAPAPEAALSPLMKLDAMVPRGTQPRWRIATPASPSAPASPTPEATNRSADRRREIESMMQRMREEMERLRSEMDRLRDDLQSSARGAR